MYLESVKYISPQTTALFGVLEPVTAVISSVLWLKVPFGLWQLIGMIVILVVVLYMSVGMKPRRKNVKSHTNRSIIIKIGLRHDVMSQPNPLLSLLLSSLAF